MPYYDELFKHITGAFPHAVAMLALKTPEVEIGEPLATEHITARIHLSDMTFPIQLPGEEAISTYRSTNRRQPPETDAPADVGVFEFPVP